MLAPLSPPLPTAPVTLDVASAHPGLNISQDLKMVTADVIAQNSSEDEVKRQHF